MPSLKDKIALITGSASGIGRGIAEHFGSLGARVVVHGPNRDMAREVADELRRRGCESASVAGDLRNAAECRRVVQFAVETLGGVDVLVNNAATVARASLEDASVEFWDDLMAVNLRAPFICLQEAVKSMKA